MESQSIEIEIHNAENQVVRTLDTVTCYSAGRFPRGLRDMMHGAKTYDGAPRSVLEVDDAYFIPGTTCLYDREGVRIPETCLRRGQNFNELINPGPETIEVPKDCNVIGEPVLYLSFMNDHWGHFLTEGTSRLWARLSYPELSAIPGFYCSARLIGPDSNQSQFLKHFGLRFADTIQLASNPTRFKKCFVPQASFSNRAEAFGVHRDVFRFVAGHYADGTDKVSDQPIYLSRAKLKVPRKIQREGDLESALEKTGVRIVYPEELSFSDQIKLFNRHRHFIGCWGSAFHNTMFSRNSTALVTDVISGPAPNLNFLLWDALAGNRANYVTCLYHVADGKPVTADSEFIIDVERFMGYLRRPADVI